MRSLIASLALFLSFCAAAQAADPTFKRVWPQWHDADSFQSFYEDHTGRELMGDWTLMRTQPDKRGGLYFVTRVENPGAQLRGTTFIVRIIAPDSELTREYTFPADVPKGSRLFVMGLTGKDWAGAKVQPVAWCMELHAADGRLLTREVSFLWEKPDR
jgi:hypothetical protein